MQNIIHRFSIPLSVVFFSGCVATTIDTHALQDQFIGEILRSDNLTDTEEVLFFKELEASLEQKDSSKRLTKDMVKGLNRELIEASVVNSKTDLLSAYMKNTYGFYSNITAAVGADGIISPNEEELLLQFEATMVPLLDSSVIFHTNDTLNLATFDFMTESTEQIDYQLSKIQNQLSDSLLLDLLLGGGLQEMELDRLMTQGYMNRNKPETFFGVSTERLFEIADKQEMTHEFTLSESQIRRCARGIEFDLMFRVEMADMINFDQALTVAEFDHYNYVASILSDEIRVMKEEGVLSEVNTFQTFDPIERRYITETIEPDKSESITLDSLSGVELSVVIMIDIHEVDGMLNDWSIIWNRPETRQPFRKAKAYLDQEKGSWGRLERQDLLFHVLASVATDPRFSVYSIIRKWEDGLTADLFFSEAEKEMVRDYTVGFEEGGASRKRLLELCSTADGAQDLPENLSLCTETVTTLADEFHHYYDQVSNPVHQDSNVLEQMCADARRTARRNAPEELKYNLLSIQNDHNQYKARYEKAVASKKREDAGEELKPSSNKRLPFDAASRRAYYENHRDELKVPALHQYTFFYIDTNVHMDVKSFYGKTIEEAKQDMQAVYQVVESTPKDFEQEARKRSSTCKGGRLCGTSRVSLSAEQLQENFVTQSVKDDFRLPDEALEEIRSLRVGEFSSILINEMGTGEIVAQKIGYSPSSSKWRDIRHSDILNQKMSFEEQLRLDRAEREELLKNPYPLSADIYPKRSNGQERLLWATSNNQESGGFQRLGWSPPRDKYVNGSYWIETKDATEGSPATYTIYGRINMPGDFPDIVYSLSEEQETPVLVESSNTP